MLPTMPNYNYTIHVHTGGALLQPVLQPLLNECQKKHRNCCKIADIAAEIANFELAPLEHMKENKNNSIVWICFADSFENDIFRNILSIKRTSHHCPHHNSSSAMYLESTSTSRENFLS